jgi:hypothetical protein
VTAQLLGASDALFLHAESRETPMHVGGLTQFTAPNGEPEDFLRRLRDELRTELHVQPP